MLTFWPKAFKIKYIFLSPSTIC